MKTPSLGGEKRSGCWACVVEDIESCMDVSDVAGLVERLECEDDCWSACALGKGVSAVGWDHGKAAIARCPYQGVQVEVRLLRRPHWCVCGLPGFHSLME
jgi:hypothetical protein